MKLKRPRLRLLPGVVLLGAGLLFLKTSGLIHGAYAQDAAPPPAAPSASAALAPAIPPANADFAGGDTEISSAAEVNVLTSLSKRRAELDAREKQLGMQANILAAAESRVDNKIAQLKSLQDQITKLLAQRDQTQEKQVASLVKTYSAMKPKDAARIFNSLSDDVLIPVAEEMKSDVLAPVLASMESPAAQKLTIKLASRLSVPEMSTPAPMPAPAMPVPAAASAAGTPAPAPGQQASAAPPAPAPAAKPKPPG